jgi:hypothetical protein
MAAASGGANALNQIATINLGFSNSDDTGTYAIGAGYNKSPEAVSLIEHLNACTSLVIFAAAHTNLAGTVDFTGMSALQHIECYSADLTGVTLTGCTALVRLCVENNNLTTINLNPVAANLYDLRAAAQQGGALAFTTLTSDMANLYHFCVRDQTVTGIPYTHMPVLQQMWIWNTAQSGTLSPVSSAMESLSAYSNTGLTSANLANLFGVATYHEVDLHSCSLTSVTLTGDTYLTALDLHGNSLNQAAVDGVLATVDGWNTNNGTLNVSSNTAPSSTGVSHASALTGRGWTVTTDATYLWQDAFQRADTAQTANTVTAGNGWYAGGTTTPTAYISSHLLTRSDTGAYRILLNPAGGTLPADYTVTMTVTGASKAGTYFGIVARWTDASANGVCAFWDNNVTNINQLFICDASGYKVNNVSVTPDNAIPSSWLSTSVSSTFALQVTGSTCNVLLDGVLVGHATKSVNSTTTGTAVGWAGEGRSRQASLFQVA